ncbi:vacuolar transporter [bacterium]|nr:vacuolar transporter [bacterium]
MAKDSTIRKFNRFELKYVLSIENARKFAQAVKSFLNVDSYGEKGKYAITSLYYDSPDYRFYWEKMEGIKFRRKLRIRYYEKKEPLTNEDPVFVEIKQRTDRVTQKRRAKLSYKDAIKLCNKGIMPDSYDPKDKATLQEVQSMVLLYRLRPTIITSYFRQAYIGTEYDLGLRITFDTNVRYRDVDLDLTSKNIGKFMIRPTLSVMEIKANESIPYWLTEMIGEHNVPLVRVSKYCQAIDVAKNKSNLTFNF